EEFHRSLEVVLSRFGRLPLFLRFRLRVAPPVEQGDAQVDAPRPPVGGQGDNHLELVNGLLVLELLHVADAARVGPINRRPIWFLLRLVATEAPPQGGPGAGRDKQRDGDDHANSPPARWRSAWRRRGDIRRHGSSSKKATDERGKHSGGRSLLGRA